MLIPIAENVIPLSDYHVLIEFNNGETRIFDVNPYITGDWFGELKDPAFFCSVKIAGLSIEWAHGQDICPDELYYNSIPCSKDEVILTLRQTV